MKTTKTNTAKKEYTRLDVEYVAEIVTDAARIIYDRALADEITDEFEVEEYEEAPGTYFIQYAARTWRDAADFNAAIIGAAFESGYFAEPSVKWEDEIDCENGRRIVSVFVADADYMTDDGHAVI